jgi:hypothetical protein
VLEWLYEIKKLELDLTLILQRSYDRGSHV